MPREIITIPDSPNYPFSQVVRAGDYLFLSGQGGFKDPRTGKAIHGIEAQTKQCLENMKQVLETASSSLDDVVKVTVFLGNRNDFEKMNKVYQAFFPNGYPARSTAITGLAIPEMLVEIECVAYSP